VEYVDRRSGGESMVSLGCVDTSVGFSNCSEERWYRVECGLSCVIRRRRNEPRQKKRRTTT
jgi:hypothetical protein